MALGTDVKIFIKGRIVYYAYDCGSAYVPYKAVVKNVGRGRLTIAFDIGNEEVVSPQSRRLCLTFQECVCICEMLDTNREYNDALRCTSV